MLGCSPFLRVQLELLSAHGDVGPLKVPPARRAGVTFDHVTEDHVFAGMSEDPVLDPPQLAPHMDQLTW